MAYEHRKTTAAEQEHSSKAAEQYRRWCMRYGATCSAAPPKTTCVDLLISPILVQTFAAELATDAIFAPIVRGAGSPIGSLIDRHSSSTKPTSGISDPKAGRYWCIAASSTAAGSARRTASASQQAAGCARRRFAIATGGHFGQPEVALD